jgi:hypothetical protein
LRRALAGLLVVPEGKRVSELERLRTPPTKSTGTAMLRALERVEEPRSCARVQGHPWRVPCQMAREDPVVWWETEFGDGAVIGLPEEDPAR